MWQEELRFLQTWICKRGIVIEPVKRNILRHRNEMKIRSPPYSEYLHDYQCDKGRAFSDPASSGRRSPKPTLLIKEGVGRAGRHLPTAGRTRSMSTKNRWGFTFAKVNKCNVPRGQLNVDSLKFCSCFFPLKNERTVAKVTGFGNLMPRCQQLLLRFSEDGAGAAASVTETVLPRPFLLLIALGFNL